MQKYENLMQNNISKKYVGQNMSINIMGNNNQLLFVNCNVIINMMGNANRLLLVRTQGKIVINGNSNQITIDNTNLHLGINGNSNQIIINGQSNIFKEYVNGFGNRFNQNESMQPNQEFQSQMDYQEDEEYTQRDPQQQQQQDNQYQESRNINSRFDFNQQSSEQQQQQYSQQQPQHHFHPSYQFTMPQSRFQPFFRAYDPMGYQNSVSNSYYMRQQNQDEQEENTRNLFSQEEFNLLPTRKHSGKSLSCTICLQNVQGGDLSTTLFCFHSFHNKCIKTWINQNTLCPICKLDLKQQLFKHSQY